jgi:hypothetical protein
VSLAIRLVHLCLIGLALTFRALEATIRNGFPVLAAGST